MRRQTSARAVGALYITATAAGALSTIRPGSAGGALLVLIMAAAVAMIPPMLFPVLKEHGEALALGYVVARLLEAGLMLPAVFGQAEASYAPSALLFCLGAAILNSQLYRTGLVPGWISGWGLAAVVPYLADALLVMFGVLTVSSAIHPAFVIPMAVNEMVLAVWLLVKGFRPTVRAAPVPA